MRYGEGIEADACTDAKVRNATGLSLFENGYVRYAKDAGELVCGKGMTSLFDLVGKRMLGCHKIRTGRRGNARSFAMRYAEMYTVQIKTRPIQGVNPEVRTMQVVLSSEYMQLYMQRFTRGNADVRDT